MSKRRLKFSKLGMGKFISHLDLLRTFTRAITRANLPVKYSQGFNPHQILTFSLPLPVGVTSETEFVDIDFDDTVPNEKIMEGLNQNLPMDIKILGIGTINCKAKDIAFADYKIDITTSYSVGKEKLDDFFNRGNIEVIKKTKRGEKMVNLADYIKKYDYSTDDKKICIYICLSAGETANIKPDLFVSTLEKHMGDEEFETVQIHRTKIYYKNGENIEVFY